MRFARKCAEGAALFLLAFSPAKAATITWTSDGLIGA